MKQNAIVLAVYSDSEIEVLYHQNNLKWVKEPMKKDGEGWVFFDSGVVADNSQYRYEKSILGD